MEGTETRPAVCQCVCAEGALGQGEVQLAVGGLGEANRSTWASPNRLQISRIVSGWSRHSPGLSRGWGSGDTAWRYLLAVYRGAMPNLGTRECSQCWSGLIWSNPSGVTAAADAICPRRPLKLFQWYHMPASEGTQAVQHCLGTFLREACRHTHRV